MTNSVINKERFINQIGADYFWVEVWMYNMLPNYQPWPVPCMFIDQLSIEETLYDWSTEGYIVIENWGEAIERGASAFSSAAGSDGKKSLDIKAPYVMRSDGRNLISIKIYPYTQEEPTSNQVEKLDPWSMSFDFVIYDIQDITDDPAKKMRAYYFKDVKKQVLEERRVEWSTGMDSSQGGTDFEKAMTGPAALKSLLEAAGKMGSESAQLCVTYDEQGSIDKPNIPLSKIDTNNWDTGAPKNESAIYYTSPGNTNVIDDMQYIVNNSKSADNCPLILDYGRTIKTKAWQFVSLSSFIKDSEKNQIEKLLLEEGGNSNSPPHIERSYFTTGSDNPLKNFTSPLASIIKNYQHSPMIALDEHRMVNAPVFNYDHSTGTYNIHFKDNTLKEVLEKTKKVAAMGLYNFKDSPDKSQDKILMNINKTKASGAATRNVFLPQRFYLKDHTGLNMLKDLIFLGESIAFQVPGLTFRAPGKIIYIDRPSAGGDQNPFDDRFLGQWIITKITHFFTKGGYINDIVASKIDAFSAIYGKTDNAY